MKLLWLTGAVLWLAATMAGQAPPQPLAGSQKAAVVRSVRPLSEPNGPVIEIIASRPVAPAIRLLENPFRLVVDLPNARLGEHEKHLDFRGSDINGVRLSQFQQNPPVARVVVDLDKPVTYTWDAAGNRLMVRIHSIEASQTAPAVSRAALPSAGVSGGVMLAGNRITTGSAVTAGADTAILRLGRGGEVLVCPRTTVSVTSSKNGSTLMLGMSTGALETHYSLNAAADSILTPDFRILLAGPGEFDFGVSADSHGNTCIQSLPGNTAAVIVSELLGDGTYQVKSTQQVLFHAGKLILPDTALAINCGCPPSTPPLMRASESVPDLKQPARGSETAELPASKPNDVHVQVDVPMVFRGSELPPAPSAPVEQASLLPLRETPAPVPPEAVITPPKPVHRGFFGKLKGFFSAVFG